MHLNLIPRSFDAIWYTCLQQNVTTRFCRQARVSKTRFVGSEKFSASLMAIGQWLNHSAAVLPIQIHVYYLYHLPVIFQAKMVEGKAEKEEGEKIAKS